MITTNFYNDLKEIKDAKDKLIKNLNATSDIKYDNTASMGTLANAVLGRNNTLPIAPTDYSENIDHYWLENRPSWYPDTKELINNAPQITKGGTLYYPMYIILIKGSHVQDHFYKANSTSSSALNYYNASGGDAYLFSDKYDDTLEDKGLEVGTAITHKWDTSKDYLPNEEVLKEDGVRWCIVYGTNSTRTTRLTFVHQYEYENSLVLLEVIFKDCLIYASGASYFNISQLHSLCHICFENTVIFQNNSFPANGYQVIVNCSALQSVVFNSTTLTTVGHTSYSCLNSLPSLTYLKLPESVTAIPNLFGDSYSISLRYLEFPPNDINFGSTSTIYLAGLKVFDISKCKSVTMPNAGNIILNSVEKIITGKNLFMSGIYYAYDLKEMDNLYCGGIQNAYLLRGHLTLDMTGTTSKYCSDSGVDSVTVTDSTSTTVSPNFSNNPNLKSIYFLRNKLAVGGSISRCPKLSEIVLSDGIETFNMNANVNDAPSLEYIKIPTTVKTLGGSLITGVPYVELWNDFDLSVSTFGSTSYPTKSIEWFKDLCVWLRNNTGATAKTLTLASRNLAIMKQIYLTYNPDNVNEITWVEQGTDGAINIVEYITGVKNWTLS